MVAIVLENTKLAILGSVATLSGLLVGALWYRKYSNNRPPTKWMEIGEIKDLCIYPVKSLKGVKTSTFECTPSGPRLSSMRDRSFVVVDLEGKFVTGRDHPKMTQLAAEMRGTSMVISSPDLEERFTLDLEGVEGPPTRVLIWDTWAEGTDCGDEVACWLSRAILGQDSGLRLLFCGAEGKGKRVNGRIRAYSKMVDVEPQRSDGGFFSDGVSFHLISEASIAELNSRLDGDPITAMNFRPNIVIKGKKLLPFEEDNWKWVKVGDVVFQCLSPCTRCLFTTVDPDTGKKSEKMEPLASLRSYRYLRNEAERKVLTSPAMGIYLGLRTGGTISLGDPVFIPQMSDGEEDGRGIVVGGARRRRREGGASGGLGKTARIDRRTQESPEWRDPDRENSQDESDNVSEDDANVTCTSLEANMNAHYLDVEEGRLAPPLSSQLAKNGDKSTGKDKVKRHSIHGMMEEENVIRPHQEMAQLSLDEKKFLLAVERGDVASTRRTLQKAQETDFININCVDPLGRSALLMAIDNENLEMVELLIEHKVETKDALLHAISEEFVEAVEVLLDHENTIHKPGEPHSWEALPPDTATFTPDITPLILAAHRDNYEIIKILLDRGATLPDPHHVRCGCKECVTSRQEDSLRHSRSRINAYRALASPSLIALSSKDPILTAFELSWELRRLSFLEHEFKIQYQELRKQCQDFATALLDHTRSSYELEVLLNHDPTGPAFEHGERMHLNRLKLAIKLRQKKFVAHPNVQQLLASIWYEGLPGFRRKNMILQALEIVRIGILFPLFSLIYIIAPHSRIGQTMRKPFIKFICNSASYLFFLFLLILASQRIETVVGDLFGLTSNDTRAPEVITKRGALPSIIEWFILFWVAGLIWSEVKQLWDVGLEEYVHDMWNVIDFVTMSLYVATVALRVVAYYRVQKEMSDSVGEHRRYMELQREDWDTWDPMLIAEGLFSAANIFSSLKLVYIFSVNPYLGPLQVSLSRMVLDIMKFFFLYVLVLFAFSCGLNQLLWYYADMEKKKCVLEFDLGRNGTKNAGSSDRTACLVWRRFSNLFETIQTLFWAVFGLIDLDSFELEGIKTFTRFWGMLMFGTYSVINIVVLLNLLIAMMNHSYQLISERADVEWKFARSKLWISYFEEGGTVPPPFNIIPTYKSCWYLIQWIYRKLCGQTRAAKKEHMRTIRSIMRNLVRRYVTVEQRKAESQGVTEDDVNEIKQDISAFRCELIEILKNSGMNTSTASGMGAGSGGKKNRQKERRLMKGFNIAPTPGPGMPLAPVAEFIASLQAEPEMAQHQDFFGSTISGILGGSHTLPKKTNPLLVPVQPPPSSAPPLVQSASLPTPTAPHKSFSKFAPKFSISKRSSAHKRRWGTLMEAAKSARVTKLINRSRSQDSVCNSHSPPTDSHSDSNPSLVDALGTGLHSLQSGLSTFGVGASALAALARKRHKFSASRSKHCTRSEDSSGDLVTISGGYALPERNQLLKRASSVPARNPEGAVGGRLGEALELEEEGEEMRGGDEGDEGEVGEGCGERMRGEEGVKPRNGSATLAKLPGVQAQVIRFVSLIDQPHVRMPNIAPLFGSSVGRSQAKNLIEFKAGKMNMKGKMVHPDKRKGLLYLYLSEDSLMHFCWKDRSTGTVEDDLIIFPDDCEFKKVEQCTTGRVYVLKFKSSNRKFFFWLQEPKTDKDEDNCKKVNEMLNNPPTAGANRSGGTTPDGDLQNLLGSMTQQQLMQLFGSFGSSGGGGQLGGLSSLLGTMNRGNQERASSAVTPTTTAVSSAPATTSSDSAIRGLTTTATNSSATTSTTTSRTTSGTQPIQLSDLQKYLINIARSRDECSSSAPPNVDLSDALNSESIAGVLNDPNLIRELSPHLPNIGGNESTEQQLRSTITSPQFQQAVSMFSAALQSGHLGPVVQQFQVGENAVNAAREGNMEEFVKALENTSLSQEQKAEEEAKQPEKKKKTEEEKKSGKKDDDMALG